MRVKDAVGRFGEQCADVYLREQGCEIVDRNWRCTAGELDIVARDGPVLVFVEVKTRSSVRFGHPVEAVDRRKIARIRRLAGLWMSEHRDSVSGWNQLRFDVVAVVRRAHGDKPELTHVRGAF